MSEIYRAKLRIGYKIAEHLGDRWDDVGRAWDQDIAARIIAEGIPLTNAEADIEMQALANHPAIKRTGPSVLDQLREALGVGKDVGPLDAIRTAIDRLKKKPQPPLGG